MILLHTQMRHLYNNFNQNKSNPKQNKSFIQKNNHTNTKKDNIKQRYDLTNTPQTRALGTFKRPFPAQIAHNFTAFFRLFSPAWSAAPILIFSKGPRPKIGLKNDLKKARTLRCARAKKRSGWLGARAGPLVKSYLCRGGKKWSSPLIDWWQRSVDVAGVLLRIRAVRRCKLHPRAAFGSGFSCVFATRFFFCENFAFVSMIWFFIMF